MEEREYRLTSEVQGTHWIWCGRKHMVQTIIENKLDLTRKLCIADVGCGFGCNIPFLREYGDVTGLEPNDLARELIRNKWGDSLNLHKWTSPESLDKTFDLILMAEVLEHIPDDERTVTWIYEHLNPKGYALITVPALKALWTQMDDVTHHQRRYTKKQLLGLFEGKFEVVRSSYYNFLLFPAKLIFVLFDRLNRLVAPNAPKRSYNEVPPGIINELCKYVSYFETELIRFGVTFPIGPSLFLLVRRR